MNKRAIGRPARTAKPSWQPALAQRARRRSLLAKGMDTIPEPVYLIGRMGDLVESNAAGGRLLGLLPASGSHGALGKRELEELFARAAHSELGVAPLRVETSEGPRHYEAHFAQADLHGRKTVVFSDITIWKRALAEKDALLYAIRSEREKPIAVCASCGAIKGDDDAWGSAGGLAKANLPPDRLSHGLCPVCLAEELGHAGLAQSAIAVALGQQRR